MFKSYIKVLIFFLILFLSCTFERRNPLDPHSDIAQNPPYDINVAGMKDFFNYGETASFTITAKDHEGDDIYFLWSSDGGTFSDVTAEQTVFAAGDIYGHYKVNCKVTDSAGLYSTVSYPVQIGASQKGILKSNEVWEGLHDLTGDIVVPQGKTLTIKDALITVSLNDENNLGGDTERIEIICLGGLKIENSTIIGYNNSSDNEWGGIDFSGNSLHIDTFLLENAKRGLSIRGEYALSAIIIRNSQNALTLIDNANTIAYLDISGSVNAVKLMNSTPFFIHNKFSSVNGIIIDDSSNPILGLMILGGGNNSFTCSVYSVINLSNNTIYAQGNWWGTMVESEIENGHYCTGGTKCIDHSDYLLSSP